MIPYKTSRGQDAMQRLRVFDGVPPAYHTQKRLVVPDALTVLRLKYDRPRIELERLSSEIGWKYADDVAFFEKRRLEESSRWYEAKRAVEKKAVEALAADEKLQEVNGLLAKYGY